MFHPKIATLEPLFRPPPSTKEKKRSKMKFVQTLGNKKDFIFTKPNIYWYFTIQCLKSSIKPSGYFVLKKDFYLTNNKVIFELSGLTWVDWFVVAAMLIFVVEESWVLWTVLREWCDVVWWNFYLDTYWLFVVPLYWS